jgi:hypothetical protein
LIHARNDRNIQLQRSKKQSSIRGLNSNHNPDLKNLFKSASAAAAVKTGPFRKFYDALIGKGIKPEMARLTLARKIAAITLIVWKRGVSFDARYLGSDIEASNQLGDPNPEHSEQEKKEICRAITDHNNYESNLYK